MLFNSVGFIYFFLPIVFAFYYFLKKYNELYTKLFLIFSSLFFYSYYEIIFLPLIISSILFNFFLSTQIKKAEIKKKKLFLIIGIFINILVLFSFKYSNFFISLYVHFTEQSFEYINLIFPLALSFFTLQQITFLVDNYQDKDLEFNFVNYCFYVTFFPQLVAGPILLFKNISTQLNNNFLTKSLLRDKCIGLYLISLGLFKKVIISDFFSKYSEISFANQQKLTLIDSWIGSVSFSIQFYYDFSAYSDLAMGLALLFGIKIINNFNSPFKAQSIIDFWQRWHISLSNFINSYMYTPLVRCVKNISLTKISIITVCVMTIIGFWHGPSINYILFGFMHGIGLVVNRIYRQLDFNMGRFVNTTLTLIFINISFVFFRSDSFSGAINIIKSMFDFNTLFYESKFFTIYPKIDFVLFFLIFPFLFYIILFKDNSKEIAEKFKINKKNLIITIILFLISSYALISDYGMENKFIYFQF